MASVELRAVHKRYDEVHVVKGLNLLVEPGEFLVLVGPSGCGKSTTLRMVAGLEELSEGEVLIDGEVVNDRSPRDRDIGMVFQSYALYPHMSVFDNIAFALKLRKTPTPELEARVREVAGILELEELLERRPGQLSGGQRQRVAMGRAIARRPRVYLFDEPLSNLDAALRVQMRGQLASLHRRLGTTMIYVTHDQVEAMTLADRIAVLHEGRLQQVGAPSELYHRPANRFVAGFIGAPSMNLVPGRVEGGRFRGAQLDLDLPSSLEFEGPATLGFRPHRAEVGSGRWSGTIQAVEVMGWESFAHLRFGEQPLVLRAQGAVAEGLEVGGELKFDLDGAQVHLFDEAGEAIVHPVLEG